MPSDVKQNKGPIQGPPPAIINPPAPSPTAPIPRRAVTMGDRAGAIAVVPIIADPPTTMLDSFTPGQLLAQELVRSFMPILHRKYRYLKTL